MGENSKIEWTDHTYNPWRGCRRVSAGCDHCYAERQGKRNPKVLGNWGEGAERVLSADAYRELPYKWNKAAKAEGVRRRVFALSLGDWLDDEVPPAFLFGLLSDIHDNDALDWLLLTKRPENWRTRLSTVLRYAPVEWISEWLDGKAPAHIWIGTSVENQAAADARILQLLQIPAALRFLSCEPLLGPVYLKQQNPDGFWPPNAPQPDVAWLRHKDWPDDFDYWTTGVNWVIVGGESGPHARPLHPEWARSLRDQCQAAHVPFFFKQWGEWIPRKPLCELTTGDITEDITAGRIHRWRDGQYAYRVGKKVAGCLLDGREWKELPR